MDAPTDLETLRLDYEIAKTKEDGKRVQLNALRRELSALSRERARLGRKLNEAVARAKSVTH